ncbi:Sorting nexin-16 [Glycine soja]
MESVNDLIQEAKLRTLWWALCIFVVSYFLTHTSKSMWMNVPMSILFVVGLRILFNRVEFRWKVPQPRLQTYLSHLEKKQLSLNDPRLTSLPPPAKWKRKIDSPAVEAAMSDFIDKILKDFVVDLWYSEITPDKEFPEQIRAIIMDVLAEISGRVKEINLVDLLTRDLVDLIGVHIELFRRNQATIGVDVMKTLSSEERDDRLKFHLLNSKELHPALISPESECKVLQRLMSAVLATVLRQREAQCPVIRSISRELLTCLVMQPIMNLASPGKVYNKSSLTSMRVYGKDLGKKGVCMTYIHAILDMYNGITTKFPCGKGEELDVDKVGVVASGELTDATAVCEAVADRHGTRAGQGVPEPYPVPRSRPRSHGGGIFCPVSIPRLPLVLTLWLEKKMGQHKDHGWEWHFTWRRNLFDSEIELAVNFLGEVEGKIIQHQGEDGWEWIGHPSGYELEDWMGYLFECWLLGYWFGYINELIESLLLLFNDDGTQGMGSDQSTNVASHHHGHSVASEGGHNNLTASNKHPSLNQGTGMILAKTSDQGGTLLQDSILHQDSSQVRPADWARMLEVVNQRRTEILMPENLENMWTKGRNYKRKENKIIKTGSQDLPAKSPSTDSSLPHRKLAQETSASKRGKYEVAEGKSSLPPLPVMGSAPLQNVGDAKSLESSKNPDKELSIVGDLASDGYKSPLKRSSSASSLGILSNKEDSIISEFFNPEFERHSEGFRGKSSSDMIVRKEGPLVPKLRCRVVGAYFEKIGSTCFAVYSIAVTDAQNKTWFVKRRYRNFERLHRHLKDIPNYTLHLPPKRIFSSSTDDAFVHQRCIQLDKYLQDLLSIANVAEQHEVWDFFSVSSKNYSFGKSPSVMKTLAVNVDDAMDDIVRQFKGVSDGLRRKVVGSSSLINEGSATSNTTWNLSWNADEIDKSIPRQSTAESVFSSDNEEGEKNNFDRENIDRAVAQDSGLHSDNALISKGNSSRINNCDEESSNLEFDRKHDMVVEARVGNYIPATNFILVHGNLEDPVGVPPEWAPPNVSVPILDLVDNIFQLNKRGWIRRQVYWISKQILQLVMEDAIDDWLLRQIHWLRREETVSQGIRWVQDVLWPGGTFFLRVGTPQIISDSDKKPSPTMSRSGGNNITKSESGSFEQELEAARRASDIKKLLFDGAPTTLVSLIGHKQYRHCARDIYYFSQSNICVKQLAYAILELALVSIFPEIRNVVESIHQPV